MLHNTDDVTTTACCSQMCYCDLSNSYCYCYVAILRISSPFDEGLDLLMTMGMFYFWVYCTLSILWFGFRVMSGISMQTGSAFAVETTGYFTSEFSKIVL